MMKLRLPVVASALVLSILPNQCLPQTRSRITVSRIKPELYNEWIDLQKNEVIPALKKGGVKAHITYGAGPFAAAGEMIMLEPIESMAVFDGQSPLVKALEPPAATRLGEKVRKCLISSYSYMSTRFDDASNILETPPHVVVIAHYRIAAGKLNDFRNLVKSDVLPVYKKANASLIVAMRGPGANPNDADMVTGYSKYADWVDGQPFLTIKLGEAEAAKLNAKFAGIRTLIDVTVRQRNDALSF